MRAALAWWFAPAPATRLAALRLCVGGYALAYVILRWPEIAGVARLPRAAWAPVGVAQILDGPLPGGAVLALGLATVGALAAFVAGAWWRVTAPIAAALLWWTLGYRSSWGMIFHTEDLLVLHVAALACTPAADAWAIGARRRSPARAGYGWGVRLLGALTVATYVLAGVAKLRLAGLGWLGGAALRDQIAVDHARKALLGDESTALAAPLLGHPGLFAAAAVATLALELGAPLALVGGRVARAWAAGAWLFHAGVAVLMNIWFPYPLLGVAVLPLLPSERVVTAVIRIARRRQE